MNTLNPEELDAFSEFINIGLGKAADVLNTMLSSNVKLSIVDITVLTEEVANREAFNFKQEKYSVVAMNYSGSIKGTTSLVITYNNALKLVQLFTGEELSDNEMDAIRVGTLSEIGNIVINGILGMISNLLKLHIIYSVPEYFESETGKLFPDFIEDRGGEKVYIKIKSSFLIEKQSLEGNIILYFQQETFKKLNSYIENFIRENT